MSGLSTIMTGTHHLSCCMTQPYQTHKPLLTCVTAIHWSQNCQKPIEIINVSLDIPIIVGTSHQRPLQRIPDLWQSFKSKEQWGLHAAEVVSRTRTNIVGGKYHLIPWKGIKIKYLWKITKGIKNFDINILSLTQWVHQNQQWVGKNYHKTKLSSLATDHQPSADPDSQQLWWGLYLIPHTGYCYPVPLH